MNKNEFENIKNNFEYYKHERKKNRFYPASKFYENILISLELIFIVMGVLVLILIPLFEVFIDVDTIVIIIIISFIFGAQLIYIKNTFLHPKLIYKNYNYKFDLLEEYKVITQTKETIYKISTELDDNKEIFIHELLKKIKSKGFRLVEDSHEVLVASKICEPRDKRLWWTYTLYRKLKYNIVILIGSISNEEILRLSCLETDYENFIIKIQTEENFTENQKDKFLISSEENKILSNTYHLKILEIGYELSTGKLYYRNPYIRIEYNSFLIKKRIGVKHDNSNKSIHDIESTKILKECILSILRIKA